MKRMVVSVRAVSACAAIGVLACGPSGDVQQTGVPARSSKGLNCTRAGVGESADRVMAKCLTGDDSGAYQNTPGHPVDVVVFVDRSASMQGFLDPAYPSRVPTDYRSVIDKALIGIRPREAFSFGSSIRLIDATLGSLGSHDFYSDRDTKTEEVLKQIARDTGFSRAYVIVTDGRRSSPDASLNQYVMLRSLAQKWIASGGSLLVAASMAPFTTVASDPSGCRRAEESAVDQRCPLYAFALVPAGAQRWLVGGLSSAFEHVYTWPAVRVSGREQLLMPPVRQTKVQFERNWGPSVDGAPIVRTRGDAPTTEWTSLQLGLADTSSLEAAGVLAALRGQRLVPVISARRFGEGSLSSWGRISESSALIRPSASDQMSIEVITRGRDTNGQPSLYRVDMMPEGSPAWIDAFDATDRNDRVRTFGLSRLFEAFRQDARTLIPETASVARFFVVAN